MKKIINIIVVSFALLSLVRCSDFLDVEKYVKDMQQYDSIFVKEKTTKEWLWETYSTLNSTPSLSSGSLYYASDEAIYNDEKASCELYQNGQYSATNQLWEDRYNAMYIGIRTASVFIYNVHRCLEVSSSERDRMEGEARFLRAYYYFTLMRQYGPVPLVPDEGQDISLTYEKLALPRASIDELVEYIVADLERAARVLPTEYASTWVGRATQGAALALRAKILLYAASPLFNGNTELFNLKDNEGRNLISQTPDNRKWARAAAAAKEVIDLGVYELMTIRKTVKTAPLAANVPTSDFPTGAGNIDPYLSYAQLFNGEMPVTLNNEFVFMRQNGGADVNSLVYKAFPYSHKGVNNMAATLKQVNAYYMRDGQDKDQASEDFPNYTSGFTTGETNDPFVPSDCHKMWLNREPRFYASIAYNGCIWENGTADQKYQNFRCNYYRAGQDGKQLSRPYNFPITGIGIKKYYDPDDSWDEGGRTTHKPHPEIRYADVLLWYAEALNEIEEGKEYEFNHVTFDQTFIVKRDVNEMRTAFQKIRFRAGLPDLSNAEYNSADTFRDKLKRERQIEFFLEGSRYFDLRRWKIDAANEENEAILGMNVDMKGSGSQKERFYATTPAQITKVFMPKMYLWPFSDNELKRNAKLTQNPGW